MHLTPKRNIRRPGGTTHVGESRYTGGMSGDQVRFAMTRAEYVSDAVVHVTGLVLVAGAVPWLIFLTAAKEHPPAMLGASIYGGSLALMILASALYNLILSERWARVLRRLDHSAIYLKIAGTYSGFALITGHGLGLLSVLWGVAAAGIWLKIAAPERYRMLASRFISAWAGWGF